MYRGELHEAEDNWNVQLSNVTATGRDGKVTHMEHIFIRGSRVRFVIVPDMLKNAPMFKRIDPKNKMKNVALGECRPLDLFTALCATPTLQGRCVLKQTVSDARHPQLLSPAQALAAGEEAPHPRVGPRAAALHPPPPSCLTMSVFSSFILLNTL